MIAEERAAMTERARELKAEAGEKEMLAKIAEMLEPESHPDQAAPWGRQSQRAGLHAEAPSPSGRFLQRQAGLTIHR